MGSDRDWPQSNESVLDGIAPDAWGLYGPNQLVTRHDRLYDRNNYLYTRGKVFCGVTKSLGAVAREPNP